MKRIIYILILLFSINSFSQKKEISILKNSKKDLLNQISILNDSLKKIETQIKTLKLNEIKKVISNSKLTADIRKGAKLRKTPEPLGEIITTLTKNEKITILDYSNAYFGVCIDSVCGYMSEVWVKSNEKIDAFVDIKKAEQKKLEELKREQELKKEKTRWAELERKYKNKYGEKTYEKLKEGYYWIGMDKEMAIIALGKPNDINRTVGSWGIHEQWVYYNIYLYFENGVLTSYQN